MEQWGCEDKSEKSSAILVDGNLFRSIIPGEHAGIELVTQPSYLNQGLQTFKDYMEGCVKNLTYNACSSAFGKHSWCIMQIKYVEVFETKTTIAFEENATFLEALQRREKKEVLLYSRYLAAQSRVKMRDTAQESWAERSKIETMITYP